MKQQISIDGLIYEAVQRVFRNSVVRAIRTSLEGVYGEEWESAISTCFKADEWERNRSNAELSGAVGHLDRRPESDADLVSVNHFYSIVDRHYDVIIPSGNRLSGEADKQLKRALLTNLKSIKDVRDPISHPPERDLSPFDALNLIHTMLRALRAMGLSEPVTRLRDIQAELARRAATEEPSGISIAKSVSSSLPPREDMFSQFIGRTGELEQLWTWLSDESLGRWVLVGEGGKGKSTIAYQFGNTVRVAATGDLTAVFWLSAKRTKYEEAAIVTVATPDFTDLDSALDKLLLDYGWREDVGKETHVKRTQVLDLMKEFPALVIVDDLDSINAKAEDVVEFFTFDAPRTGSKILMTSRRAYPGMNRCSTPVAGLPHDDAVTFLQGMSARLGLNDEAIHRSFETVIETTEGSPLYMEDMLRLFRRLPVKKALERWKQDAGDSARRYALERERELLTPIARDVLDACCLSRTTLTVAQLERILNRTEEAISGALSELEQAYLVPGAVLVDGEPTFRVNRNLEWLVRREVRNDPSRLGLHNAVERVLGNTSRDDDRLADHIRQTKVLIASRRSEEAVDTAESALAQDGMGTEPLLLAVLAESYASTSPPRMADARRNWVRAEQLGLSNNEAFVKWCMAEDNTGDWQRMADAAQAGLHRCGQDAYELKQLLGYACTRMGQAQRKALDNVTANLSFGKANDHFKAALKSANQQNAPSATLTRIYRGLVINATSARNTSDIVYWAKEWLEVMPRDPSAQQELRRLKLSHPSLDLPTPKTEYA